MTLSSLITTSSEKCKKQKHQSKLREKIIFNIVAADEEMKQFTILDRAPASNPRNRETLGFSILSLNFFSKFFVYKSVSNDDARYYTRIRNGFI